jgi:hypothetical protein
MGRGSAVDRARAGAGLSCPRRARDRHHDSGFQLELPGAHRNALDAANQRDADLSANKEPARRAVASRSLEAGSPACATSTSEVNEALEISEQTEI